MRNRLILVLALATVPAGLMAQTTPAPAGMRFDFPVEAGVLPQVATYQFISAAPMTDLKQIKGAPFSADGITEFRQVLGNGTVITRNNSSKLARDSEGRTRTEQSLAAMGPMLGGGEPPRFVNISDPVAHQSISLNENEKRAVVSKLDPETRIMTWESSKPGSVGGSVKMSGGVVHFENRVERTGGPVPQPATRVPHVEEDVIFSRKIEGAAAAEVADVFAFGGAHVTTPDNRVQEDLGSRNIEGVMAQGTRTTTTIPAGTIGNDRAMSIVSERWYSPELQLVILTETKDPQSGDTTYRLTNIRRTEPDRSLFQVPADYTQSEVMKIPGKINIKRAQPE